MKAEQIRNNIRNLFKSDQTCRECRYIAYSNKKPIELNGILHYQCDYTDEYVANEMPACCQIFVVRSVPTGSMWDKKPFKEKIVHKLTIDPWINFNVGDLKSAKTKTLCGKPISELTIDELEFPQSVCVPVPNCPDCLRIYNKDKVHYRTDDKQTFTVCGWEYNDPSIKNTTNLANVTCTQCKDFIKEALQIPCISAKDPK